MADLIDRAALLEIVNKINVADDTFGKAFGAGAQVGVEIAANKIKKAPAVDAVEVVRCKDCMWQGREDDCPLLNMTRYTDPDEFCSYGERKET